MFNKKPTKVTLEMIYSKLEEIEERIVTIEEIKLEEIHRELLQTKVGMIEVEKTMAAVQGYLQR